MNIPNLKSSESNKILARLGYFSSFTDFFDIRGMIHKHLNIFPENKFSSTFLSNSEVENEFLNVPNGFHSRSF